MYSTGDQHTGKCPLPHGGKIIYFGLRTKEREKTEKRERNGKVDERRK
jgi:hypothetical protein